MGQGGGKEKNQRTEESVCVGGARGIVRGVGHVEIILEG